jgi:hypothetical protein
MRGVGRYARAQYAPFHCAGSFTVHLRAQAPRIMVTSDLRQMTDAQTCFSLHTCDAARVLHRIVQCCQGSDNVATRRPHVRGMNPHITIC